MVGVPEIVYVVPDNVPLTPAGAPVNTALVAEPPIVYTIEEIPVPSQIVWVVLPEV